MLEYVVLYKCRRCAEEVRGEMLDYKAFSEMWLNKNELKTKTHICKDGKCGVCDFVGYEKLNES